MRIALFLLFLIVSALPATAQGEKEFSYDRVTRTGTIRCGYFAWPPFLSKDINTGQMKGISMDILQGIGDILDLKVDWTMEVGTADYMAGLKSNRFDALCVSSWPHPTRFKESLATIPLFYTAIYPVVRSDDTRLDKSYDVLRSTGLKMGTIEGDDTEAMIKKKYPKAPRETLPNSADYTQLIAGLLTKKSDVIFLDKSVVHDFIKSNGPQIKIAQDLPVMIYPEYLFVDRDDIALKLRLDAAIQILRDRGDMGKFLGQYVTSSTVEPPKF